MDRAKFLWIAFLVVWALSQLVYGAIAPWAVAATAGALVLLHAAAFVLLPGGLSLSRVTVGFLAAAAGWRCATRV